MFTSSGEVDYLENLGALDGSSVVVTNYVLGASNCISTSKFYAQCCVDPCDELMAARLWHCTTHAYDHL